MSTTILSVSALIQSARRSYSVGAFADAVDFLSKVPLAQRSSRDFLLLYGASLARIRRRQEAEEALKALLDIDPDCHEALTWMAVLTKDPHNPLVAIGYARRAVELRPEDATGYNALGTLELSAREPDRAIGSFSRAVDLDSGVAEYRHNLALAYLMLRQHGEAIVQLRKAIALAPLNPQSYLTLASTYRQYGKAGEALECLSEGLSRKNDSAPLHSAIASAFSMIRNEQAAERHHRRALELSPEFRSGYATWLLNQGRFEEANNLFDQMIREGSDPAFAYFGLAQSKRTTDSATFEAMESLLANGALRPQSEMYLRYALGRSEEQRRNFGSAMRHFEAANRFAYDIYQAGNPIDPASFRTERLQVQELYEALRSHGILGDAKEGPIFIVGMIRSGTTLLDQIVSSHPKVASGGELRFWIEEVLRMVATETTPREEDIRKLSNDYIHYAKLLADSEGRFTDKMPLNFAYAGILNLALPNARILHIRRNPVDTCLSIYTTFFGQGALFAYHKRNIISYYREYLLAMEYWRTVLPTTRFLEVDYEELISEPELHIPRIIEFCGLEWDEACLHHEENQSAINTPSRWQARQPIYKTSMEKWRRYEPWLGEFSELLTLS